MSKVEMKTFRILFLTCGILLTLTNCHTNHKTNSQSLVVENKECFLKYYTHINTELLPLFISIDLPVSGPQPLMDTLTDFLNETLYHYFDNGDDRHIPYKTAYSKDIGRLVEHYHDTYKPFFLPDSSNIHEFNSDGLMLKLVAQTDTYVTYEIDWVFFGEGDEVTKEWVTFLLADGHRVTEIMNNANMLKFYEEHPEQRNKDVWEHFQYKSSEGDRAELAYHVGLLNDFVIHQYSYAPGIFEDVKYSLDVISPYLSKEAKEITKTETHD